VIGWLRRLVPRPEAAVRLVCFPHAGGGASVYRAWANALPDHVEVLAVQYPGRGDRHAEPGLLSITALADAIAAELSRSVSPPYALFGHSVGAIVAYETAVRLSPAPSQLVVSGRSAPRHTRPGTVHRRGEPALLAELDRYGGTPPAVLADPELRALLLSALAADVEAIETYRPDPATPPLDCPISVLLGDADDTVTPAEAADWADHTTTGFDQQTFPGGHFYLHPPSEPLRQHLATLLPPLPLDSADGRTRGG
jgi:pyochelin biosynthetic protein PchC